jgi:hypothetical protein
MAARRKGSTVVSDETDRDGPAKRPHIKLPPDFQDVQSFLAQMRKDFYDDISYDKLNRDAALEDLRFVVGDQWDDDTRLRRQAARKPCLTINRIPAFVAQVIGARRMNETTVKVLPDNGGTQPIARVREGLIRSILKLSHGEKAFDKAFDGSVMCGIGNLQVEMDYESDEVFDQVLKVTPINDHLAVVWDRMIQDPTGKDAGHCFVVDTMTKAAFNKRWPWAVASDIVVDMVLRGDLRMNGWISVDDVRVVSYWRVLTKRRTLAMMTDGTIQDITDKLADKQEAAAALTNIQQRKDGTPVMREVDMKYAQMYLCSGLDVLEGPYDLPISRVPVVRVPGWELNIAEWKHRWGLTRFLKDPQRMHNFTRSVKMEKMQQTPRGVWAASDTAVAGREQEWRNSHLSDDPLLIWNAESGQKPERIPPAQLEQAWASEAEASTQDLKDVSNIHEANLGMPSNEVSGAAIVARQRVSDTGTVIYQDNIEAAIEETGQILNQLISVCYDTPRKVKILGDDGKEDLVAINGTDDPDAPDLSIGKYSVTVKTAPSSATKRLEAAQSMMAFINASPQVAGYTLDLVAEAMDWPKHEEFARRIRLTLPPGMVDPKDMTPDMMQRQQEQQQSQAQAAQMQFHMAIATYLKTQSETALNSARAEKFTTDVELAPQTVANSQTNTASQAADRELRGHLEAVRVADGK